MTKLKKRRSGHGHGFFGFFNKSEPDVSNDNSPTASGPKDSNDDSRKSSPARDSPQIGQTKLDQAIQNSGDISNKLWNGAYTNIQSGDAGLVETYEVILTRQLQVEGAIASTTAQITNVFAGVTPEVRQAKMKAVTQTVLESAGSSADSYINKGALGAASAVTTLNSLVGGMLASYPPAALAWSGVCTILPMLVGPLKAAGELKDGLDYVIRRMEWFMSLARVLLRENWEHDSAFNQFHGQLYRRVQGLYQALLTYVMQAVCWSYHTTVAAAIKKGLKGMVSPDEWKAQLKSVQALEGGVRQDISQYNQTGSLNMLVHIEASTGRLNSIADDLHHLFQTQNTLIEAQDRKDQEVKKKAHHESIGKFKTSAYEEFLYSIPERVDGTCEWFRQNTLFKDWISNAKLAAMLLTAEPGSGKTVLAKHLVQEALRQHITPEPVILYYFFKDVVGQKELHIALCAILHQLLSQKPELLQYCMDDIDIAGNRLYSDAITLWKVFKICCANAGPEPIVCVFDALDECESAGCDALIRNVRSILEQTDAAQGDNDVKFFFTSPALPRIVQKFSTRGADVVRLDGDSKDIKDSIRNEIGLVMEHRLTQLSGEKGYDDRRQDLIRKGLMPLIDDPGILINEDAYPLAPQLVQRTGEAGRTYLWIDLVFKVLEDTWDDSEEDLERLVKAPPNIFEAYEKLLSRIPDQHKSSVRIMLQLILVAQRPLTITEMSIAMKMATHIGGSDEKRVVGSDDSFKKWINQTCGFFITIYDQRLYLVHHTAKAFLLAPQSEESGNLNDTASSQAQSGEWHGFINIQQAHAMMAGSCISYLSLTQFKLPNTLTEVDEFLSTHDKPLWHRPYRSVTDAPIFQRRRFLHYTCGNWLEHFRLSQVLEGSPVSVKNDIEQRFQSPYMTLFEEKVYPRIWWLQVMRVLKPRVFSDFDGPRGSNKRMYERLHSQLRFSTPKIAVIFGHIRLLQSALGSTNAGEPGGNSSRDECQKLIQWSITKGSASSLETLLAVGSSVDEDQLLEEAAANGHPEIVDLLLTRGNHTRVPDIVQLAESATVDSAPERFLRTLKHMVELSGIGPPKLLQYAANARFETFDGLDEGYWKSMLPPSGSASQGSDLANDAFFVDAYNSSFIKFVLDQCPPIQREPHDHVHSYPLCSDPALINNLAFLLHAGVYSSPSKTGDYQWSMPWAMNVAVRANNTLAIRLLFMFGQHLEAKMDTGQTFLHVACDTVAVDACRTLLELGADANAQDKVGFTPAHAASMTPEPVFLAEKLLHKKRQHGDACAMLFLLRSHGAELDKADRPGRTPLHMACWEEGCPEAVSFLLAAGANSNATTRDGRVPLHVAAAHGNIACAKALIDPEGKADFSQLPAHVELQAEERQGMTPLHIAAMGGEWRMVEYLLRFPISPDGRPRPPENVRQTLTPLLLTCIPFPDRKSKADDIDESLGFLDDNDKAQRQAVAWNNRYRVVYYLLAKGAAREGIISYQGSKDDETLPTPLQMLQKHGEAPAIEALLQKWPAVDPLEEEAEPKDPGMDPEWLQEHANEMELYEGVISDDDEHDFKKRVEEPETHSRDNDASSTFSQYIETKF
ncbi:hypothetical protein K461DRAFT_297653 [Myriangium duriaei CBS 260.36]|uniref:NWD NACHT-NTPase N-terminal domain-containing protein n=1 Tax=Myriangium duriaei CBS 260.36 TaxID=1168546 RepID=A0A9P4ITH0_9PEZI|nr:hypothetical protein K461DRAFT_297653 [Myriangium duriaei CBS 260.36]